MKGQVLDFSVQSNEGVITCEDGKRYKFSGSEWKDATAPQRGLNVDFDSSEEGVAKGIYLALGTKKVSNNVGSGSQSRSPKSKVIFLLLTFFLGGLGIHKFYMGSWGWGILYIVGSVLLFLGTIASVVEFIRFLILSEDEFQKKVEEFQNSNPGPFSFFW